MAIRKSELYSSLWKSCDELRGGMDASQYKDYVLVLLFVKYVSDKARSQANYLLDVPDGGSFRDMTALRGNPEIGDKLNKIVAKLAEANGLKGVIDVADFNDPDKLGRGKEMVDRLSNLVGIFDNPALDFSSNTADGDDLLGDAYEYLMRHFATESGKSKGQFYTPAEVSRIIAKVLGLGAAHSADQSIYDPTCGSGSLLLKAHGEAKSGSGLDLAIYGQEMDNATAALARMNMILHDAPTAEITPGGSSTLANPFFLTKEDTLKTFDWVVANPPFSSKNWRNGFLPESDPHQRFPYGPPPARNGDYAFLLHILASLKSTGQGACILPHGVLFRGGSEGVIRREIVSRGFVKGIIGLPANLFYGTGIPACIVVLDKGGAAARTSVFLIDASRGFMKDGAKNRLRAQDIHKVVDTFTRRAEIPGYSRDVPLELLKANEYNLNIARYVHSADAEDVQDVDGHLRGGIPLRDVDALNRYWKVLPSVRSGLFARAARPGYCDLGVDRGEIGAVIFGHPEFSAFTTSVAAAFDEWRSQTRPLLVSLSKDSHHPKELIATISETLLATFQRVPLVDPYDVYQRLMEYWATTMQDDIYLIVQSGWLVAGRPRLIVESKDQKTKETPDYTIDKQRYRSDILPGSLLIDRYLADERAAAEAAEKELAACDLGLQDLADEHGGEGGLLEEATDEKGSITKRGVTTRLKEIGSDPDAGAELDLLRTCQRLLDRQAEARKTLKAAQGALTASLARQYRALSEDETRMIVVDQKWFAALRSAVQDEVERVSQALAIRVRELALRYETTMPAIAATVTELDAAVRSHLEQMGYRWT